MSTIFILSYLVRRDLLFPPALFSAVWLASLVGLLLCGELFFPVSASAILVFLLGAMAFLAGSIVGLLPVNFGIASRNCLNLSSSSQPTTIFLDFLFIVLLIGLPLYWRQIGTLLDVENDEFMFRGIRTALVERGNESAPLGLIGNFAVLAYCLALAAFYEMDGTNAGRIRMVASVLLALVYGLMSGTKGSAVVLLLTLFFISWIKSGELNVARLFMLIGGTSVVFGIGLLLVNLVYLSLTEFGSTAQQLGETILNYWLGGLVGFQRIVEDVNAMESSQPVERFFLELSRSLGWNVYVPNLHAEYTNVGPTLESNTYTLYFTYFKDFGWIGTALWMSFLGCVLTYFYRVSLQKGPNGTLLYSMMCVAIVLSFHAEHFFLGLNGYIKAIVFFYIAFNLVPLFRLYRYKIQAAK
jgi:oligosaccharide repeat unit polymerase